MVAGVHEEGSLEFPPRWLPAPSATAPTSPARWRRRPPDVYAMSFSFLSGRTFTDALAGLAFTSIVSPGRNGFGTFFRALCAGFFTTLIFIRPGIVQAPTAPFWTWRSMTDSSASNTRQPWLADVFILSLKAGGIWWNPAVENQATDRAFRIGQQRNVLVHKFVTSGTIEEKIELMLAEKRQLADELIDGDGEVNRTELPDDELLDLVRLDVTRAAP